MIKFHHKGKNVPFSLEERKIAENKFIKYLDIFKEEFEKNNGIVTVNYDVQSDDLDRYTYILLGVDDFTDRLLHYKADKAAR